MGRSCAYTLGGRLDEHLSVVGKADDPVLWRLPQVVMSRKGDGWDNAVAESFFHVLKSELAHQACWDGYTDTHRDLFEYIETYYNRDRLHSTLGYLSPAPCERRSHQLAA